MPRKKKPARGRPRSTNPAVHRVNFRVTLAQRKRYAAAANAAGVTLTKWIETLLDRAAPEVRK